MFDAGACAPPAEPPTDTVDGVAERWASYYTPTSADYDNATCRSPTSTRGCPSLHVRVHRRLRLFERAGRQRRHGARRRMCSRSYPGVTLKGVELVPTRIGVGETKRSVTVGQIELGRGEALPFPDRSFDVVCEIGVLHHGAASQARHRRDDDGEGTPSSCPRSIRFGRGSLVAGSVKLLLWELGMWVMVDRLKTRGRGYRVEPIDGVSFSYSLYDSFKALSAGADRKSDLVRALWLLKWPKRHRRGGVPESGSSAAGSGRYGRRGPCSGRRRHHPRPE
jgi:hypothetical protein